MIAIVTKLRDERNGKFSSRQWRDHRNSGLRMRKRHLTSKHTLQTVLVVVVVGVSHSRTESLGLEVCVCPPAVEISHPRWRVFHCQNRLVKKRSDDQAELVVRGAKSCEIAERRVELSLSLTSVFSLSLSAPVHHANTVSSRLACLSHSNTDKERADCRFLFGAKRWCNGGFLVLVRICLVFGTNSKLFSSS